MPSFPPKVNYGAIVPARPRWMGSSTVLQPDGGLLAGGGFLSPADFPETAPGVRFVPSGTLIGRTFAERDAHTGYGMGAPGTDDELFLLAFDIANASDNADCELYKPRSGLVVFENFLPPSVLTAPALLAWVRANYICRLGMP